MADSFPTPPHPRELLSLNRVAELTDSAHAALRALSLAVYPPDEAANWPGRHLEWAAAEWCVRVWGGDGELASYTGMVLRQATYDGQPVRIGGVGGVKTHPAARRHGYAGLGVRRAVEFFHAQPDIAFGLLVCAPHLLGYYARLGWQEFGGRMLIRQHGAVVEFTFNRIMTCDVRSAGPAAGTIDLCGPPW
jgi:hypothetical protein